METLKKITKIGAAGSMALAGMLSQTPVVLAEETEPNMVSQQHSEKSEKEQLEDQIAQAEEEKAKAEQDLEEAEQAYQDAFNNIQPIQNQYNTAQNSVNQFYDGLQNQVAQELVDQISDLNVIKDSLDSLNSNKEQLESSVKEKEAELQTAKEELEKAQQAYDQAVEEATGITDETVESAKKDYEDAQAVYDQLLGDLKAAQEANAKAQQDYEAASAEYDAAYADMLAKQEAYQLAQANTQAATEALNEAQQKYDELTSPDVEETLTQNVIDAQNALQVAQESEKNAKDAYDSAVQSEQIALENVNIKQGEIDSVNSSINSLNGQVTAQESVIEEAKKAVTEAEENAAAREEEYQKAIQATKDAQVALETANQNVADKEEELTQAKAELAAAEQSAEQLKTQADNAQAQINKGIYGFFESNNDSQALDILKQYGVTTGMSLDDLYATLDFIAESNTLRAQHGLDPMKVSNALIAISYVQLQGTVNNFKDTGGLAHMGWYPVGENIAYNMGGDPFAQWYEMEKQIYDNAVAQDPSIAGMTSSELQSYNYELWIQVGHYLNILDPNYDHSGFSVILTTYQYESGGQIYEMPVYFFGQVFDHDYGYNSIDYSNALSVEEYKQQLDSYYDRLVNANTYYQNALTIQREKAAAVDALNKELSDLKQEASEKQLALTNAQTTENELAQAVEDANALIIERQQNVTNAQDKLDSLNIELEGLNQRKAVLENEKSDLDGIYELAQKATSDAKSNYDDATEATQLAQNQYDEAVWEVNNLEEAQSNAEENLEKAKDALTEAQNEEASALNAKTLSEQTEASKKEVLDTAATAKDEAEDTVAEISENVTSAKEERDSLQETCESYVSKLNAVDEAQDEVSNWNSQIRSISEQIVSDTNAIGSLETQFQLLSEAQAKAENRRTELENLQEELATIYSGESIVPMQSEDSFVLKIQSHYQELMDLIKARDEAKAAWEEAQATLTPFEDAYLEAKDNYDSISAQVDALWQKYNELISEEMNGSSTTQTTESTNTLTSQNNGTQTASNSGFVGAIAGMAMAGAGVMILSRKRKNQKLYESLK